MRSVIYMLIVESVILTPTVKTTKEIMLAICTISYKIFEQYRKHFLYLIWNKVGVAVRVVGLVSLVHVHLAAGHVSPATLVFCAREVLKMYVTGKVLIALKQVKYS